MNPEREQDFLLGEFGKAYFDMSSLNGGWNGVSASLTTNAGDIFQKAIFQFDDGMVAEGELIAIISYYDGGDSGKDEEESHSSSIAKIKQTFRI